MGLFYSVGLHRNHVLATADTGKIGRGFGKKCGRMDRRGRNKQEKLEDGTTTTTTSRDRKRVKKTVGQTGGKSGCACDSHTVPSVVELIKIVVLT